MTRAAGAFSPEPGACIPAVFLYYFSRHILPSGGAPTGFFQVYCVLLRWVGLGFLIAKSRFECRGREREWR